MSVYFFVFLLFRFQSQVPNDDEANFCLVVVNRDNLMPMEGQLSNNKLCSGHSSNRCANNSTNNNGNNNNNVGGPLMSVAHLNGQVSGISARGMTAAAAVAASHVATSSNSITFGAGGAAGGGGGGNGSGSDSCNPLTSLSATAGNTFNYPGELEFDFFRTTPWDLDGGTAWTTDRPESRASGPTNSRPPSQPAPTASPSPQGTTFSSSAVAPHCSPLRPFSPTTVSAAHTFSNSFSFSPLQESTQTATLSNTVAVDSNNGGSIVSATTGGNASAAAVKRTEETNKSGCPASHNSGGGSGSSSMMDSAISVRTSNSSSSSSTSSGSIAATAVETQNNSVVSTESGRLRNLLTKGPGASEDSQDNTNNEPNGQHRILKILLNQRDEDDYHSEHKVCTSPSNMSKPSSTEHSKSSLGNNMLLQVIYYCRFTLSFEVP